MDTIYEDPEEQGIGLKGNWLSSLRRRFQQSTISVQDCSLFVYCILGTVILSYSFLSDSILDIFYYVSHESEAIATAYTQILEDLQYAFAIIGGLMADCLYGRVPVMVWSYLAYTVCVSISFLVVSFASPVFYLVFALVTLSSMTYGVVISCTLTLVLNYDSLMTIKRSSTLIRCICKVLLIWSLSTLLTRTVMTWIPFLPGFRILSLLYRSSVINCSSGSFKTTSFHQHSYSRESSQGIHTFSTYSITRIQLSNCRCFCCHNYWGSSIASSLYRLLHTECFAGLGGWLSSCLACLFCGPVLYNSRCGCPINDKYQSSLL